MVGPATASNNLARTRLYLNSAKAGSLFNREFTFYSGSPTTPVSFTGNQVLGTSTGGPGAYLINGVGPPLEQTVPCDEPRILDLSVVEDPSNTFVFVEYTNPQPDDIYVLFSTGGASFGPSAVGMAGNDIVLTFPPTSLLPTGSYSLKIIRATDPQNCFTVRRYIFSVEGCTLTVTQMSSPTGFPVFPPGPAGFPGGSFPQIDVVGTGFLSGPLTITLTNQIAPFDVIVPSSVTIVDDNNLMFSFNGNGVNGPYLVRIELTADPTCFGMPPEVIVLQFS